MKQRAQTGNHGEVSRNRDEVMQRVFEKNHVAGADEVPFTMDDIRDAIAAVARLRPGYQENNVADVRYQYTSGRRPLPESIAKHGPWMIVGRGKARYAFVKLSAAPEIKIQDDLLTILLPDATPEIVLEYAGSDEQGLLAKVHYNRMLDIFLQITCYHLQNHWRTSIKHKGQCEIDDLYVGLDLNGRQFVVPVEAKCASESLSKTQIAQMIDFARERYPQLILRPVGVQEMSDGSVVLLEFSPAAHPDNIKIKEMRRYKLAPMADVPLAKQQKGV
ncbi:MAG: endonuclease [Verrucomicrobia bacterium]|nr:endonuclease [Verrucomicrobiota bacterium]